MTSPSAPKRPAANTFAGFDPLDANYVYCPNQFFDICLPHCSRGCLRLVAYILRQTLGWLDADGQPICQDIRVSYNDLISQAGISRGAIRGAIDEATSMQLIECVTTGQAKDRNQPGRNAEYRLRWGSGAYTTKLSDFSGFFTGEGNRTPVPNAFFDHVIRQEPLAVTKVVGTVIRHTVGYQNQFGRRPSVPMSFERIAEYANVSRGKTVNQAVQVAERSGYIVRLEQGQFGPTAQKATRYSVRWQSEAENRDISSKIPPESDRSKNPTRNGSKFPAADRFKNPITKKTHSNNTYKQQQIAAELNLVKQLVSEGFDDMTATKLIESGGVEVASDQLAWLEARNPTENRIGMLRKAIEENWPMPQAVAVKEHQAKLRERDREKSAAKQVEEAAISKAKQKRHERKQRLLAMWERATLKDRQRWIEQAVKRESSKMLRQILRRESAEAKTPHVQVLDALACERNLPAIAQVILSDAEIAGGTSKGDSTRCFDRKRCHKEKKGGPQRDMEAVPCREHLMGHDTGHWK